MRHGIICHAMTCAYPHRRHEEARDSRPCCGSQGRVPWPCDQGHRAGNVTRSSMAVQAGKPSATTRSHCQPCTDELVGCSLGTPLCASLLGGEVVVNVWWPQMSPTDKATWRKRRLTLPDVVARPNKTDKLIAPHCMWEACGQQHRRASVSVCDARVHPTFLF